MFNILVFTFILSIWHSILFIDHNLGLSVLLFTVPLLVLIIYVLKTNKILKRKGSLVLSIVIILLSSTYFIFNNSLFRKINIIVIPILLLIMLISSLNKKPDYKQILSNISDVLFKPLNNIGKVFNIIRTKLIHEQEEISPRIEKVSKLVDSLLVAIPIMIVIIILLSSADLVFANIFKSITNTVKEVFTSFSISTIIIRAIDITLVFIYLGAFFNYLIFNYKSIEFKSKKQNKTIKNDNYTLRVILVCLNLVYFLFCIIQIKSLFLHSVGDNINYSEYARTGFFQLMFVSFINFILILAAKFNENKDEQKVNSFINIMCIIMIIFTFIIVISSFMRMNFYEIRFGYTYLRLLVYVALLTETTLLIPTILYILDKKVNLPKMYFIIIISIYTLINFLNFDNLIATRNVDRYFKKDDIDIEYIIDATNTDATDQLIRLYKNTSDINLKFKVKSYLYHEYYKIKDEEADFRSFNYSKEQARKKLKKILNK